MCKFDYKYILAWHFFKIIAILQKMSLSHNLFAISKQQVDYTNQIDQTHDLDKYNCIFNFTKAIKRLVLKGVKALTNKSEANLQDIKHVSSSFIYFTQLRIPLFTSHQTKQNNPKVITLTRVKSLTNLIQLFDVFILQRSIRLSLSPSLLIYIYIYISLSKLSLPFMLFSLALSFGYKTQKLDDDIMDLLS